MTASFKDLTVAFLLVLADLLRVTLENFSTCGYKARVLGSTEQLMSCTAIIKIERTVRSARKQVFNTSKESNRVVLSQDKDCHLQRLAGMIVKQDERKARTMRETIVVQDLCLKSLRDLEVGLNI